MCDWIQMPAGSPDHLAIVVVGVLSLSASFCVTLSPFSHQEPPRKALVLYLTS